MPSYQWSLPAKAAVPVNASPSLQQEAVTELGKGAASVLSWAQVVLWEIATGLTPVRGDMRDLR